MDRDPFGAETRLRVGLPQRIPEGIPAIRRPTELDGQLGQSIFGLQIAAGSGDLVLQNAR